MSGTPIWRRRRATTGSIWNWASEDEIPLLMSLPDGEGKETVLKLPYGKVKPIIRTLVELSLDAQGRLRMSRYQAAELDALNVADLEWGGADAPRKFAEKLAGFKELETVPPPKGLEAELRPYQQQGLNWLQFLRQYELGGILADDMGLGKTVQALAHLLVEKESGRAEHPSLVVATTSLMVNWASEAARFAPSLKMLATAKCCWRNSGTWRSWTRRSTSRTPVPRWRRPPAS